MAVLLLWGGDKDKDAYILVHERGLADTAVSEDDDLRWGVSTVLCCAYLSIYRGRRAESIP